MMAQATPSPATPTPIPTPTPTPTLATEINAATRGLHAELNRLILDRLPLALPPHSPDPSLYVLGLTLFANLYTSFERCWRDVDVLLAQYRHLQAAHPHNDDDEHAAAVLEMLAHLIPPSLWRTQRLQHDLLGKSCVQKSRHGREHTTVRFTMAYHTRHIENAVRARPHVLIAYAWVMYMAIFSGGRYVRAQLAAAGEEFWSQGRERRKDRERVSGSGRMEKKKEEGQETTTPSPPVYPGFTFLHFDAGTNDGEDLKSIFKQRLARAETLLNPSERADVVAEARCIFESMVRVVQSLDEIVVRLLEHGERERESAAAAAATAAIVSITTMATTTMTTVMDEKAALLLSPPTAVDAVRVRFAERKSAARRLGVALAVLLVGYVLVVCCTTRG